MNPDGTVTMASAPDFQSSRTDQPGDPFQAYCEAPAYYPEAAREQALKLLVHLAPYSDLLVVTGAEGAGKSLLLQRFLAGAGETWRVLSLRGGPAFDDVALIDELDREFSIRPDAEVDRAERLRRLRRNLQVLRRGALQPILVMDDAHLLPRSAFALFSEITEPREDGDKLLGIVLCGETEALREKLSLEEARPLQSRVAHAFELASFSEADTAAYILHRLTAAGCSEEVGIFTPAVIRFIRTASRGLPGRINGFARNLLQERGHRAEAEPVSSATSDAGRLLRYGAVALALSLLVVVYFYRDQFGFIASPDGGTGMELATLAPDGGLDGKEEAPPVFAGDPADEEEGVTLAASFDSDPDGSMPEPEAVPPMGPIAEADPTLSSERESEKPGDNSPVKDRPDSGGDPQAQENISEEQKVNGGAMRPEPTPAGTPPRVVEAAAPAPTPPAPAPAVTVPPAAALPIAAARREAWLLAQPAGSFTLQLLASNEARILGFIEEHGLQDRAAVFLARGGDQPLYAVTWGVFPSRSEAALAAESETMRAIRGVKPWVRSLRDIHGAIAAAEASAAPAPNPM